MEHIRVKRIYFCKDSIAFEIEQHIAKSLPLQMTEVASVTHLSRVLGETLQNRCIRFRIVQEIERSTLGCLILQSTIRPSLLRSRRTLMK